MSDLKITKASGSTQAFDSGKLCKSIQNAGADEETAKNVCEKVKNEIKPGDSTSKIFRKVFRYLSKENIELSARYALERAINSLGPAGFLFEQYIEAVLQSLGYETKRNVFIEGQCITHEIDVIADKGNERYLVEAKYRNGHKIKTHIDQVMYADARLADIKRKAQKESSEYTYHMIVMTNAYFTKNSIDYSECRDIKLFGWRYPKDVNLMTVADEYRLYPVTVLPSLTNNALGKFAKNKVILLQDLIPYSVDDLENKFGIDSAISEKLYNEIHAILVVGKFGKAKEFNFK